ncbi:MAG: XRE family transcriptional regulator, partial [Gammaproteobacteria bacterium]|nr:XRE family transcriptional regulator [Gammaproteobacteria bacterium]
RWAAHPLPAHATGAADAIVVEAAAAPSDAALNCKEDSPATGPARVRPVRGMQQLERNVLVAGCAPLLANLAHRVGEGSGNARATWIPASSHRALDLLAAGMVHIAGLHLSGGESSEANVRAVRRRFPGRRMLVVNLTRWRQGFVVAASNPLDIRDAADLLRPGVRVVGREPGTGAEDLFARLLAGEGSGRPDFSGPVAEGHLDVARRVHCGAADTGVAIESAALAWGLGFVPLVEERFDLVIPADIAEAPPVSRFLETLDDPGFRTEAASLPGYDTSISGHASTLEAGGTGS